MFRTPIDPKRNGGNQLANTYKKEQRRRPSPPADPLAPRCGDVGGGAASTEASADGAVGVGGGAPLGGTGTKLVPTILNFSPSPPPPAGDKTRSPVRTSDIPAGGGLMREVERLSSQAKESHKTACEGMKKSGNIKREIKAQVEKSLQDMLQIVNMLVTLAIAGSTRGGVDQGAAEGTSQNEHFRKTETIRNNSDTVIKEIKGAVEETKSKMAECALYTRTLSDQIKNLEKEMSSWRKSPSAEIPMTNTYAMVAAGTAPALPKPMHSIIIKSTEPIDTSSNLVDKIRAAVDAKENGIRIDKVRKAGDQKVVVGCHNKKDLEAVKSRLGGPAAGFLIEEAVNRDPLVVLLDVMKYNTDDDIIKAVTKQNSHLLQNVKAEDIRVAVKYRKRAKSSLENHVVVQVSPPVWQRLTVAGRAHVDLQRVRVMDQSPLIQCSRCLGFGHGRKLCEEKEDHCAHCCNPGHLRANCPSRQAGDPAKCKNCSDAKKDPAEHDAFHLDCPVRKRWDAMARSTVAYS